MSVELFFETLDAAEFRKKDELSFVTLSRFLVRMQNAARERIIALGPSRDSKVSGVDPDDEKRIVVEGQYDVGALCIAAAVPILHETLVDKRVDLVSAVTRVNNAVTGTILETFTLDEEDKDESPVDSNEWNIMASAAEKDKTFAVFFKQPNLVPERLRNFFLRYSMFERAKPVIDDYKRIAATLVSPPQEESTKKLL